MNKSHAVQLQNKLKELVNNKAFYSVVLLAPFVISALTQHFGQVSHDVLTAKIAFSNALFSVGQFRRAAEMYEQTIQLRRRLSTTRTLQDAKADAAARYKTCQCYIRLGAKKRALRELVSIPKKFRNLAACLCQGRLNREMGCMRQATMAYRDALKHNPFALEALVELQKLGETPAELIKHYKQTRSSQKTVSWIEMLVHAEALGQSHQPQLSVQKYRQLQAMFPRNPQVLLGLARQYASADRKHHARQAFAMARRLDSLNLDAMDQYAYLLHSNKDGAALSKLAVETFRVDSARPEPWNIAALFCELHGQTQKALQYVTKAVQLAPHHAFTYIVKGAILLLADEPRTALTAFGNAMSMHRTMHAIEGQIQCLLKIPGRQAEAKRLSKSTYQKMPDSSKASALYGRVLMQTADPSLVPLSKAKKLFERAYKIDPHNLEAMMSLGDIYRKEGNIPRAIAILLDALAQRDDVAPIHSRLADLYCLKQDFTKALRHYHTALRLHPTSDRARKGLVEVQSLIKSSNASSTDVDDLLLLRTPAAKLRMSLDL